MKFFIYRNCFTGAVSGGDVHTGGVAEWIYDNKSKDVYLVHPKNDNQSNFYNETKKITQINYTSLNFGNFFALTFVIRALLGSLVKLPWAKENTLIAGSHFLPDVVPVAFKGFGKNTLKAVYIHHIVQDMHRPKNLNTRLANIQEKICFHLIRKRFDKIIVVNKEVKDRLVALKFNAENIFVSSNFVSFPKPQALPLSKKEDMLVFCGRMVPQKGVYDLLKIIEILERERRNFKLVMIGIGPELEKLKAESARKNLSIDFMGFVSDEEKAEQLRRALFFVFPSREEGWGIAIAEAMLARTPVLAYHLPVYDEVFGPNLTTVPLDDYEQLAQKIIDKKQYIENNPEAYELEQQQIGEKAKHYLQDAVAKNEYNFIRGL